MGDQDQLVVVHPRWKLSTKRETKQSGQVYWFSLWVTGRYRR